MPISEVYNMDCMEYMKGIPDKFFELAIVDPPYGIGVNKMTLGNGRKKINRGSSDWDSKIPDDKYFKQLFRVSKIQIIWGANHMIEHLYPTSSWILLSQSLEPLFIFFLPFPNVILFTPILHPTVNIRQLNWQGGTGETNKQYL